MMGVCDALCVSSQIGSWSGRVVTLALGRISPEALASRPSSYVAAAIVYILIDVSDTNCDYLIMFEYLGN